MKQYNSILLMYSWCKSKTLAFRLIKMLLQKRIQNPVKHLRWSLFKNSSAVNYFCNTLYLRCLIGSWISLYILMVVWNQVSNTLLLTRKQWLFNRVAEALNQKFCWTIRSSHHRCSKNSVNLKGKRALESVFNKVADLQACKLIKKRRQHRCLPVKLAKFLGIP